VLLVIEFGLLLELKKNKTKRRDRITARQKEEHPCMEPSEFIDSEFHYFHPRLVTNALDWQNNIDEIRKLAGHEIISKDRFGSPVQGLCS
jgi:hypothetical protein